jgi:hypothetical protein
MKVRVALAAAVAGAALACGVAFADSGTQLTADGQRDTPSFTFSLDKPAYQPGEQVTVTWSGFTGGWTGELWIEPASQPFDPNHPSGDIAFMSTASGVTTITAPPTAGYDQVRAVLLKSPAELIATDDVTIGNPGAGTGTGSGPGGGTPTTTTPPPTPTKPGGGSTPTKPPIGHAKRVAAGHYGCYTYSLFGTIRSSIQSVTITSQTQYSAVGTRGRFTFSRSNQLLRFTSGFLRGAKAHYVTSPQKALDFKRNENLRHGRPWLDLSATYCYFGKK